MNFQRVCGKIVEFGHVDLFFGCEVGGKRDRMDAQTRG